jgi:hypothetical protein
LLDFLFSHHFVVFLADPLQKAALDVDH